MLDIFNIPHDGHESKPWQIGVYLGVEYNLILQACRIPCKKLEAMINVFETFIAADPYSILVNRTLMDSITGKLLYYTKVNLFIRPLLDPFIRLKCFLPNVPYLKHHNFKVSRFGRSLLFEFITVITLLLPILRKNKFVDFDWIAPQSISFMTHVYTDASDIDDCQTNYDIGVFIEDYGAFQLHRSLYSEFLSSTFSNKSDPYHINHQELLAFLISVWLIVTKFRRDSHKKLIQFRLDNQTCFFNICKNKFRSNFAANHLLLTAGNLLQKNRTRHELLWIPTAEMAVCVADTLSRVLKKTIVFKSKTYIVTHLSNFDFTNFTKFFKPFSSDVNEELLRRISIPDLDSQDNLFSLYWISILLSAARSIGTNNKISTYGNYFELFKSSYGIFGPLFSFSITFDERFLMYFAVNLLIISKYTVKTAKSIVYQTIRHDSLDTISCPKTFYILADLFRGAQKLLRRSYKNRLILSPAVSKIYNSTMNWKTSILENALVGADALAIGAILRSAEYLYKQKLDPSRRIAQRLTLSKLSDNSGGNLITTDPIKLISKVKEWLTTKPEYLLLQLEVYKTDYFHKGCELTVCWGTEWFPIWEIILHGLVLRHEADEILTGNSYVFAFHPKSNSIRPSPQPLSYSIVLEFDKVRSKRLGLPVDTVKTHDRRRALPSEIACLEDGTEFTIRTLARWSLKVMTYYTEMSEFRKAEIQLKALLSAEKMAKLGQRAPRFSHTYRF